jgi:catechol 2,3-dioxygenase-like lactoylglutathione lyase family enzyme
MHIIRKKISSIFSVLLIIIFFHSFSLGQNQQIIDLQNLNIQANIAFFYYNNLPKAVDFYENILGLKLVLDYGFAKTYQISQTSFICLVDETKGMHNTSEPKTVTLSFITQEIDAWYDYLNSKGVKIHSPLGDETPYHIRGFVVYDSEGYFLEFETFLDKSINSKLLQRLSETSAIYPQKEQILSRPDKLGIQGTVIWLYYNDLAEAQEFYENVLGLELLVDQGFAKVYFTSPTASIGLVDAAKGLHRFSQKKSVNIGFITRDVDKWYRYLCSKELEIHAHLDKGEEELVRAFVAYDRGGYYLEFDQFQEHEKNRMLLDILKEFVKIN